MMPTPPEISAALAAGTTIGGTIKILRCVGAIPAALLYQGQRLSDGALLDIVELWPASTARDVDGQPLLQSQAVENFAAQRAAYSERLSRIRDLVAHDLCDAFEGIEANATLYAVTPQDNRPSLDTWSNDLLRRATQEELGAIVLRIAAALQGAHERGMAHGLVSTSTIRLDRPENARLAGFVLPEQPGTSESGDMLGLARALYTVVTGRPPPQTQDGFLPDPRHAASHIAADDYPPALLVAIDSALGLGGMPKSSDTRGWFAKLFAAATMAAAPHAAVAAHPAPTGAKTERRPGSPATPAEPRQASAPPAEKRRTGLAFSAIAATLVMAATLWIFLGRSEPETGARPEVAAPAASTTSPAAPAATASAPPPEPAKPEPIAPPALPPSPPPPPDPATRLAAATTREEVLSLKESGADAGLAGERLKALGYAETATASGPLWLKPGAAEVFRDCADCPALVLAPAGQVQMTLALGGGLRTFSMSIPAAFAAGRHEVTRREFRAFIAKSGHTPPSGCHVRAPAWRLDPSLSWDNPGFAQTEDDPVACVSFTDAQAYVAWLSRETGQRYRLPTDPEWHYLALRQAGLSGTPDQLCTLGNGADETARENQPNWTVAPCRDGFAQTAPVGRFAATDWGLTDLNGNLWEWVDTCAPDASGDNAVFPPPQCPVPAPRILRGGSFADPPAMRLLDARIVSEPGIRDQVAGFRVVREMTP